LTGVSRINPFVRGMLIVAAISAVIVVLKLQATLTALFLIARIAFLLAIAFFIYLLWREHRHEISMWPTRARWVFYSAGVLIVTDIAAISFLNETGPDAVVFVVVLAISAFAMWRTWKDQNTYV
jgi:preprotein translocase subunit YajC